MEYSSRAWLRSALLAVVLAVVPATYSCAATLVMVDWDACWPCRQFQNEIAGKYPASREGEMAPLRLINVLEKWPTDLKEIRKPRATPVFILVERGHEIGEFSGYSGPTRFWRELDKLLARNQWQEIMGIFSAPPS